MLRIVSGTFAPMSACRAFQVTRQLANRFKPDPSRIKSCIESLITREYLRRGDVDLGEYRYVA